MTSPYREPPQTISLWKPRTFTGKLRSFLRKVRVFFGGKFTNRFSRCRGCGLAVPRDRFSEIEHVIRCHYPETNPEPFKLFGGGTLVRHWTSSK